MFGSHWKWQDYKTITTTTKSGESLGLPRDTGNNQIRIFKNLIISLIQLLTLTYCQKFLYACSFCVCVCLLSKTIKDAVIRNVGSDQQLKSQVNYQ